MLPGVFANGRRKLLCYLVLNGMGQFAVAFATAALTQRAFDTMLGERTGTQALIPLAVGLLLCAALLGWLRVRERIDAERTGQSYSTEIRLQMYDKLNALPLGALDRKRRGSMIVRFVGDLKALRTWASLGCSRLMVAAICNAGGFIALTSMHYAFGIAAACGMGLGMLVLFLLGEGTRKSIRDARRLQARLTAQVGEQLSALATVQTNARINAERIRVLDQSERFASATIAQTRHLSWLRSATDLTGAITSIAVLMVGAYMVATDRVTVSTVVAAMTLAGIMAAGLREIGSVYGYWSKAQISKQKLIELLLWPSLRQSPCALEDMEQGSIEFREVTSGEALSVVSQSILPGEMVALVGQSTKAKSTALHLVARLIDPDAGAVFINGHDIGDYELNALRREIGLVSMRTPLMRGTVGSNLRYRLADASQEALSDASRWSMLDEIVSELPEGLATKVQEGGANLSLRQRSRIALARAMLGQPKILLIDEVETLFGSDECEPLLARLRDYPGTVLFAVRDIRLARLADRSWVLDDGCNVADSTTATRLAAQNPASSNAAAVAPNVVDFHSLPRRSM